MHPDEPVSQQRMPEAEFAADTHDVLPPRRKSHLIARMLPHLNQGHGVMDEAFPGRRQTRTRLVADEQPAAKLVLQRLDPGAHRRLGQVQTLRGGAEAATRQYFEKRAG